MQRTSSLHYHSARASRQETLASRVSHSVATRLSCVGASEPTRDGTVTAVVINTLCNVMGAGVLSLPLALYNATVVPGILLLLFIGLMSAYAVYCLVVGCDATGKFSVTEVVATALYPPRTLEAFIEARALAASGLTDPQSPVAAAGAVGSPQFVEYHRAAHATDELKRRRWRRWVTVLVELIIFLSNYGTLIIYTRVIIDSIPPVLQHTFKLEGFIVSELFWLLASGVVFFSLSCARNMEELKWSSLLGFLTILYIVVFVVFRFFTARNNDYPHVTPASKGEMRWCGLLPSALLSISTYGVAFGYHFNVPYFYKELRQRDPSTMMRSVAVAFPVIIVCYAATGFFGYWTFGNEVASAEVGGNIVSNYPKNDILMNIGRLGLFMHFACVFPVVSICARRGLHRLAMTALLWREQSDLMELAAGILGGGVQRNRERWNATNADFSSAALRPPSPLSSASRNACGLAAAVAAGQEDAGGGGELTPLLPANFASFPVSTEELDRDLGSPDDTTRLAIVLEAFLLVSTTVFIGGVVSGISIVIDVIGTLFGVFLILIVPGIIGLCVFSPSYIGALQNSSDEETAVSSPVIDDGDEAMGALGGGSRNRRFSVRYACLKRILCMMSVFFGVVFTVIGAAVFCKDQFFN